MKSPVMVVRGVFESVSVSSTLEGNLMMMGQLGDCNWRILTHRKRRGVFLAEYDWRILLR